HLSSISSRRRSAAPGLSCAIYSQRSIRSSSACAVRLITGISGYSACSKRRLASVLIACISPSVPLPLSMPSCHRRRNSSSSFWCKERRSCQSRKASRTTSLLLTYSPFATAARTAAASSGVSAMLIFSTWDMIAPPSYYSNKSSYHLPSLFDKDQETQRHQHSTGFLDKVMREMLGIMPLPASPPPQCPYPDTSA